MNPKRSAILSLPVAVIAVLALFAGSVGGAAASGLTTHAVKKIAAKVVKKKAKKLTVKNAKELNGQPASAYQDPAAVFTLALPATTPTMNLHGGIPLGVGSYVVSYSAKLVGAKSADTECAVNVIRGGSVIATTADSASETGADLTAAHSGSGVITVAAGDVVAFGCAGNQKFSTDPAEPIQIVATPLDSVTTTAVAPIVTP